MTTCNTKTATMRLANIAVLLSFLFGLALAQLPPGTPSCATPCFIKSITISSCAITNTTCLCADAAFASSLEGCTAKSCQVEDLLKLKNATNTACGLPVRDVVTSYTIVTYTLTSLVFFFVVARVVYKQYMTDLGLGGDDWTIVAFALGCVPLTILNAKLAEYGLGKDVWTLTPTQIIDFGIVLYLTTVFYYGLMALLKISILLFYLRIFPNHTFRVIVFVTITVVSLYGIAFTIAQIFQCWPIQYNWLQWKPNQVGSCVNTIAIAKSHAAIGIAFDFWMLFLPMYMIRGLNASWRKKIAVGSMFVVGTFVTVVSIIRLVYVLRYEFSNNITYDYTTILVWSTVEVGTGVICACMPSLRLILIKLWPRVFESRYWSSNNRIGSNKNNSASGHGHSAGRYGVDSKPRTEAELDDLSSMRCPPLYANSISSNNRGKNNTNTNTNSSKTATTIMHGSKDSDELDLESISYHAMNRHQHHNDSSSSQSGGWKNRLYNTTNRQSTGTRIGRVDSPEDVEDDTELQPSRRQRSGTGSRGGDSAASVASSTEIEGMEIVDMGPLRKQLV